MVVLREGEFACQASPWVRSERAPGGELGKIEERAASARLRGSPAEEALRGQAQQRTLGRLLPVGGVLPA